jgi:hypothetical protein
MGALLLNGVLEGKLAEVLSEIASGSTGIIIPNPV